MEITELKNNQNKKYSVDQFTNRIAEYDRGITEFDDRMTKIVQPNHGDKNGRKKPTEPQRLWGAIVPLESQEERRKRGGLKMCSEIMANTQQIW